MARIDNSAAKAIEQNLIDRLSGRLLSAVNTGGQFLVRNVIPSSWMNPGQPLTPVAQEEAHGRQWDYPVGYNLRTVPRQEEPTTFATLRGFADSYDLLRILIDTRKDQMCVLEWTIKNKTTGKQDSRCLAIQELLQYPDKIHTWEAWLRLLLEDLFVIDAPAVYPLRTLGNELYSLEIVDGATIRPLIDVYGRSPLPPSPAYQQHIKGVPATDYTRDQLIYMPRNPRSNRVYGLSPVEMIIMTVNIALRRQIWQLMSFTEGNVPDALLGVPDNWTPDQISQFQMYWDSLLEGNLAAKRHAKFVPGGINYHPTAEHELFGHAEEWLARVVCFALSMSPQPFVNTQNRATAETAKEAATQEGLEPLKKWVVSLMNLIITQQFGYKDLEFAWVKTDYIDPAVQATIDKIYLDAGVYNAAYVADRLGIEAKYIPEEKPQPVPGAVNDQGQNQAQKQPEKAQDQTAKKLELVEKKKGFSWEGTGLTNIEKINEHHDALGRFAHAGDGGAEHIKGLMKDAKNFGTQHGGMATIESMKQVEFNGLKVFYNDSDSSGNTALQARHFMENTAHNVPEKLLAGNKSITFTAQTNQYNEEMGRELKIKGYVAKATAADGEIVVYDGGAIDKGMFAHESAHNFANKQFGSSTPPKDVWESKVKKEPHTSDYGKVNRSEDFAESVRAYVTYPLSMPKEHPVRYEIIKGLLEE